MRTKNFHPNLFLVGAGKSGSTLLWEHLSVHSSINMSLVKEPDFFSVDENWDRGIHWYRSCFSSQIPEGSIYVGEASNSYSALSVYPSTIERMKLVSKNPKIIYSVRHPMRRLESDWMEFAIANPSLLKNDGYTFSDFIRQNKLALARNDYLYNYSRYLDSFSSANVLLVCFEDLVSDISSQMRKVYEFLGLQSSRLRYNNKLSKVSGPTSGASRSPEFLVKLRRTYYYNKLSSLIPSKVKGYALEYINKKVEIARPLWSQDDINYFCSQYEEATRHFLRNAGWPSDKWILQ